jgi:hypothetical protein
MDVCVTLGTGPEIRLEPGVQARLFWSTSRILNATLRQSQTTGFRAKQHPYDPYRNLNEENHFFLRKNDGLSRPTLYCLTEWSCTDTETNEVMEQSYQRNIKYTNGYTDECSHETNPAARFRALCPRVLQ